jgi:periplasmic protein TonB
MTISVAPAGFAHGGGRPLQRSLPGSRDQIYANRSRQPRRLLPDDFADRLTAQSSRFAALGKPARESSTSAIESADDLFEPVDQLDLSLQDETLDTPDTRLALVGVSRLTSLWSGSLFSLAIHGALAAVLVAYGLSIDIPAVEGEQIVTVVMLGDASADEAAGDAAGPAPETTQNLSHTAAPVKMADPVFKPEPAISAPLVASVSKPVYPPKPDTPPMPAMPLLASPTPAKTSVPEPPKEFPRPDVAEPIEIAKPKVVQKPVEVIKPQVMPKPLLNKEKAPQSKPALPPVAKAKPAVDKPKPVAKAKPVIKPKADKAPTGKARPDAKGDKSSDTIGKGKRDAKKGQMDGSDKGTAAKSSAGKSASGTGNAKASTYPGLVQRKIARTRQKPSSGKGSVIVSFSVTSSGALAGVSLARSSGNAAADSAALDHIRRSAPFPAPPAGAQTRFQIPVAIR